MEPGDLPEPARLVLRQRRGRTGEQRAALTGEELLDEHLADEVVPEAEAGGLVDEQPLAAQLVHGDPMARLVEARGCQQHPPVDRRRERRRCLQAVDRVGSERLAAREHDMARTLRQAVAADARGEQLLDEERVAPGPSRQGLADRLARGTTEDRGGQLADGVVGQWREVDPFVAERPFGLGEERQQRVLPVELVAAVRADEQHVAEPAGAQHRHEERPRRLVGPVEILDGDDERAPGRDLAEQGLDLAVEAGRPLRSAVGRHRHRRHRRRRAG